MTSLHRTQSDTHENQRERLYGAFSALTADERQLLTCALAGNHPPKLAHLRMPVLRSLARANGDQRRELEAHARDYAVIRANRDLADHIDRYLKQRLENGRIPPYVETALATVEEKLREESARLVRVWD